MFCWSAHHREQNDLFWNLHAFDETAYCHVLPPRRLQSGCVGDHSIARQRDGLINLGIDLSVTLLCTGVDKTMMVAWISMNLFTDTQNKHL